MIDLLFPACAVLLGYVVLGITGFGSALVVVPLLAWRWPLPEVVALTLLLDVMASLLLGGLNLRQVDFAELRRLLPGMVAGALAGLWLSRSLDASWPLLVLGLYVAAVGAQALRPRPARPRPPAAAPWALAAGGAIGVVEMLFGTAGPLVVAWLSRRLPDVHALRASTPVVITVSACSVLLAMGWAGRLSQPELWTRWLALVGVAAGGVLLGHRWARHVSPAALRKLICGLLVVSGLTLVVHTLQQG
ncbi:sulfite exporter TauE/SafE family protein [Bordetella bronchiseptica]|uniref:Probable membrane transporter protein n=5 Tax=Bordetella bronchiseptica TaxID=518 RepID=A0A0H3LIG3_BORBR|nr:sulfite exporter TauE/SafE family protein [Bordetella bronchiseptica]SHR11842.1 Sulfite exporter TauE/SafE [Mycobacteroides abscessus subsp. abscessus]AMG87472.1 sulfite exporter TauE/SafE family protein [Bordetella bronchiseptica]AWP73829.1 anion permease [Bordetella bronchiseptica]AWP78657.1 anion permease [Bordetella bronchiseptica]AWP83473.1 anion permease [Bordetella bronchiseptica]